MTNLDLLYLSKITTIYISQEITKTSGDGESVLRWHVAIAVVGMCRQNSMDYIPVVQPIYISQSKSFLPFCISHNIWVTSKMVRKWNTVHHVRLLTSIQVDRVYSGLSYLYNYCSACWEKVYFFFLVQGKRMYCTVCVTAFTQKTQSTAAGLYTNKQRY